MFCFTYEMMLVIANDRLVSVEIKSSSKFVSKTLFSGNPTFTPFSPIQNLQRIWDWFKKENCGSRWELQCWWTKFFKFPKRISNYFENTVFRQLSPFQFQTIIQKLCIFWKNFFWRKCVVWKVEFFIVLEFFKFFRKIQSNFKNCILGFLSPFQNLMQIQFSFQNLKMCQLRKL